MSDNNVIHCNIITWTFLMFGFVKLRFGVLLKPTTKYMRFEPIDQSDDNSTKENFSHKTLVLIVNTMSEACIISFRKQKPYKPADFVLQNSSLQRRFKCCIIPFLVSDKFQPRQT